MSATGTAAPRSSAPARARGPLAALLAANAVSLVGSQLSLLALPWFVLATTGSASRAGLTAATEAVAVVIGAVLGGGVVDRLGPKRASVAADLASGTAVAAIPALYHAVGLPFPALLGLVFMRSLFDAPGATARLALVPEVAATATVSLDRANAAAQAVGRGARLLGAPLAGVLIAYAGPTPVLLVDAATFTVSAGLVAALVAPVSAPPRAAERYLDAVTAGLRFVRHDRLLWPIVVAVALLNAIEGPIYGVVLPVYVRQTSGDPADLGALLAGVGGGALVGAVGFAAVGARLPRRATFLGAFLVLGLPYWVLTLLPPLGVATAALVVAGMAAGPINPIIHTAVQERTPEALRGRAFGALFAVASAATPAGMLLGGYLLEWVGARVTLLMIAGGFLAVTLGMLAVPAFRDLDRAAPTAP